MNVNIVNVATKFINSFKNISNIKLAFTEIISWRDLSRYTGSLLFLDLMLFTGLIVWIEPSYVGQTRRLLKERIDKHKNHIRRNVTQTSVITEHRLEYSHDFDWNNIPILGWRNSSEQVSVIWNV